MKRTILLILAIMPLLCFSQAHLSIFSTDSVFYKTDTISSVFLKKPRNYFYDTELLKWSNGTWETKTHIANEIGKQIIYIPDKHFKKTYEYRKEIEKYSEDERLNNIAYMTALKSKYGKFAEHIYRENQVLGMTEMMFAMSMGGRLPDKINVKKTSKGKLSQWVYYLDEMSIEGMYYYFTNGILTTIQE